MANQAKGVYKNCRFMYACTSVNGLTVQIQTQDGSIWEGVFETFNEEFTVCLLYAIKITPSKASTKQEFGKYIGHLHSALEANESVQNKKFIDLKDIVRISTLDVDLNLATKENALNGKLETDAEISGFDSTKLKQAGELELETWEDDGETITLDSALGNENGGWDPERMFEFNKHRYGVESTWDENLYTSVVPHHDTKEWREKKVKAAAIAKEIEDSAKSKDRTAKEDGDEEEKYSAVHRPIAQPPASRTNTINQQHHKSQSIQQHQQNQPSPQQHHQAQNQQQSQHHLNQHQQSVHQQPHQPQVHHNLHSNQTQHQNQHQQVHYNQQPHQQPTHQSGHQHPQHHHQQTYQQQQQTHQQQPQPQAQQQQQQQQQQSSQQQLSQVSQQTQQQQSNQQSQQQIRRTKPKYERRSNNNRKEDIESLTEFSKNLKLNTSQTQNDIVKNSKLNPHAKEFVYKPQAASVATNSTTIPQPVPVSDPYAPMCIPPYAAPHYVPQFSTPQAPRYMRGNLQSMEYRPEFSTPQYAMPYAGHPQQLIPYQPQAIYLPQMHMMQNSPYNGASVYVAPNYYVNNT